MAEAPGYSQSQRPRHSRWQAPFQMECSIGVVQRLTVDLGAALVNLESQGWLFCWPPKPSTSPEAAAKPGTIPWCQRSL